MSRLNDRLRDGLDLVLSPRAPSFPALRFPSQNDSGGDRPVAWLLSHTPVAQEPRVIRQAWSLLATGWRVVVAGYEGSTPVPSQWHFLPLSNRARGSGLPFRAAMRAQRLAGSQLNRRFTGPLFEFGGVLQFYGQPNWRQNHVEIRHAARQHPGLRPALVIAHDYDTCPAAAALAAWAGAKLLVDCHEYARGQYEHDAHWQRTGKRVATALQDRYLAIADAVTTVCDGIAERLSAEQKLRMPAVTVRSVPFHREMPFRAAGEEMDVLYHGLLTEDRGLEALVASVRHWRPGLRLTLRGHGDPHVVAALEAMAKADGVADRISFVPSVPFDAIVPAANAADIGYFVQPGGSPQKNFTLPNKFFEYTMAGLALAVSDLPEMARLVTTYDLGVLIDGPEPDRIASALNALTIGQVNHHKQAALAAARELCWEREQEVFLALVERVTGLATRLA